MRPFAMLELIVCTCVASACAAGSANDDGGGEDRDDGAVETERDVIVRPRREPAEAPERSIDPFGPLPPSPVEHVDEQETAPIFRPPHPRRGAASYESKSASRTS